MNLYLHNVEPHIYLGDTIYEPDRGERYDVILTNPPFGAKGADQAPEREDFTIKTSNKQLNFVQHIVNILKPGGRATIVLPDNCLFEDKAREVFEIVMQDCALHTVLRLPRGTFTPYSQGVKANVINLGIIKEREVPMPTCLEEQSTVVKATERLLAFTDRLEARLQKATVQVNQLTQSILARAFRGELVPTEAELAAAEGRQHHVSTYLAWGGCGERATGQLSAHVTIPAAITR